MVAGLGAAYVLVDVAKSLLQEAKHLLQLLAPEVPRIAVVHSACSGAVVNRRAVSGDGCAASAYTRDGAVQKRISDFESLPGLPACTSMPQSPKCAISGPVCCSASRREA